MAAKPLSRVLGRIALLIAVLALTGAVLWISPLGFIAYVLVGQSWSERQNAKEYDRHRAEYDALVLAIQARNIPAGKPVLFRVDSNKSVATLRPIPDFDRGSEVDTIIAERKPDGRLTLRICTYSMGHAGVYGLYYSGGTPAKDEVQYLFGIDGRVAFVGPNWWTVSDYSQ